MRTAVLNPLIVIVGACLFGAADPSTGDLKVRVQGTWQAQTVNDGSGADPAGDVSLTIVGNRTFLTEGDRADASIVTLGVAGSTATFDLKGATSGDPGISGIIEVQGDTLRVAYSKSGPRPASFDPAVGKIVMTFKRVAPDAGPPTTRP